MAYQDDDTPESIAGELLEEDEAADLVARTGEQMPHATHAERHDALPLSAAPEGGLTPPEASPPREDKRQ